MEFWGVEVKSGQPLKVLPQYGKLIHISQVALGEVKDVKGAKHVPLHLKVGNKNFILGALSAEGRTQLMFDLVFEKEFELSHDWKNGSVYVLGYMAEDPTSDGEDFSDEFDDESEDEPVEAQENGKIKEAKNVISTGKAGKKKIEQSEEDDSDSDEEEPPKVPQTKKRPAESPRETALPTKKPKSAAPEKTGNKKPNAVPLPSKPVGKASPGKKSQSKAKNWGR